MKAPLLFNFTVDKENNTIRVERQFNGDLELVWKAWTTASLLDQWWAPEPYRNVTKSLDFREGGHWLYSMVSPENQVHWARFDYEKIEAPNRYMGQDGFCDEEGNINQDFSRMHWNNRFRTYEDGTLVEITISVDTLDTLEKIIAMGFREGFTMGLQQLDNLLPSLKKNK